MRNFSLLWGIALCFLSGIAAAQELRIVTVERPPFAMQQDGKLVGFAPDLWNALSKDMGLKTSIELMADFGQMLDAVAAGKVDAAVANISITSEREMRLDFTQPIFESGLQIMIPSDGSSGSPLLQALLSKDLLIAIALAFAMLFGGGMLMWFFERGKQPYFNKPARKALFPAFWWALNLVVNGGFEERVPQSRFGRFFAVFLVVSSLFLVSVFVAKITATLTVNAIQGSVHSINDLYGKRVGTTSGSTAANYLELRDLKYKGYGTLDAMLADFEKGRLDAVVFDAPVLAYYVNTKGKDTAQLVGSVFRRENYGIALPTGSNLAEPVNRSLLNLRENGTYDKIYRKWFGSNIE